MLPAQQKNSVNGNGKKPMARAFHASEAVFHQLKTDRELARIKQEEVAQTAGVALGTISETERGIAASDTFTDCINEALMEQALIRIETAAAVIRRALRRRTA